MAEREQRGPSSGTGIGIGIGTVTGTVTGTVLCCAVLCWGCPGVTLMCAVPRAAAGRGKRNNYFSDPQGNIKKKKKKMKKN